MERSSIALATIVCTLVYAAGAHAQPVVCDDHGCRAGEETAVRARHHERAPHARRTLRTRAARAPQMLHTDGSHTLHPWIAEARRYVGGNPTGWSHEWCARFANMVLDHVDVRGSGSNRADSFAGYGDRVPAFTPGSIAAGDHHVAFVVGCSRRGCLFISGNDYGHLVREVRRDTSWVKWWRMPHVDVTDVIPIPRPRPATVGETIEHAMTEGVDEVAHTLADVVHTLRRWSHPGDTMTRQGPEHSLSLLQPEFARRIAETIEDARAHGIDVCIFSAYRPPGYGVGGFKDKFNSLHAVGLAVDFCGLGSAGSATAVRFHRIAAAHKVWCIYGPYNRAEWNHCQGTKLAVNPPALRRTINARGPKDPARMWSVAARYLDVGPDRVAHSRRRHVLHGRRQEAG